MARGWVANPRGVDAKFPYSAFYYKILSGLLFFMDMWEKICARKNPL